MSCTPNNGQCATLSFDAATNRINTTGFSYDAAGNLTADGTGTGAHTYQWDGEGRMSSVDNGSTSTITYNALGQGVEKMFSGYHLEFLFDPPGNELGRYSSTTQGLWWEQDVGLGSRVVAFNSATGGTEFTHFNHLGTSSMTTDWSGSVKQDQLMYPFGQNWKYSNSFNGSHFASSPNSEPDAPNFYQFPFRSYDEYRGRWLTPDPVGGDVTNPQSLNRYAYVVNNPTTLTDPLGLDTINCTIRNGCREPGGNGCTIANGCRDPGMNLGGFGGSCYIDGLPSFCNVAYQILNAGSGGTTVSSVGGFLTFQVPIPPGAVQSTFMDPTTGQPIGSTPGALYPASFETVTTNIPGFDFPSIGSAIKSFVRSVPWSGSFSYPWCPFSAHLQRWERM